MIKSYLFVPADDEYKMSKAINSKADAVIFDLEDSIETSSKEKARKCLESFIQNNNWDKHSVVRINSVDTKYFAEDIKISLKEKIETIMIPKVNSSNDIFEIEKIIKKHTLHMPEVIPIIETAQGLNAAYSILKTFNFINKIAFGAIDFALDLNIDKPDSTLLENVRIKLVLDSRLAGKEKPIDSVNENINSAHSLEREAKKSKGLGLFGKMAIHPTQIDIINKVFSITDLEKKQAREIIFLFEKAIDRGEATIQIEDKMIDYPVYYKAKSLLRND